METDGLPRSDGGILEQQLDRVRAAIVGAVQKGHNLTKKHTVSVLGCSAWVFNQTISMTAGDLQGHSRHYRSPSPWVSSYACSRLGSYTDPGSQWLKEDLNSQQNIIDISNLQQ